LNLADLPNSDAEKAYGIIRSNISRYQTPFATGYAAMAPVGQMAQPMPSAAMGVRCPKCGQTGAQGAKFCGACGATLQQ